MRPVGEILRQFLAGRLTEEEERTAAAVAACREALGESEPHARVRDIRGETLVLAADHPGWAQLVLLRKPDILRHLQEKVPGCGIRSLRVVVERDTGAGPAPRRRSSAPPGSAGAIEGALGNLNDEALKRSLRALYERAEDS